MEHSLAALQEAGDRIDALVQAKPNQSTHNADSTHTSDDNRGHKRKDRSDGGRRGGRQDDSGQHKRRKKGDMGRGEYFRTHTDKRKKIDEGAEKRQENPDAPTWGVKYTAAEIEAEERKPKRKVAVFISYSGTGYRGMQIMPGTKTIEGDLYEAFIKAGAISKANANDPKKASLVRCARTDKGVHAAGNMISLKLIIEDENIVEKINAELPPQIRVWGIERTTGSFSCYQQCDSRWYEYFIPSYAFLPPWPNSHLGIQLRRVAEEVGDLQNYEARQADVKDYWEDFEEQYIRPVLETIDEDIRPDIIKALQGEEEEHAQKSIEEEELSESKHEARSGDHDDNLDNTIKADEDENESATCAAMVDSAVLIQPVEGAGPKISTDTSLEPVMSGAIPEADERLRRLRKATKQLRNAILTAKRRYRISNERIERLQAVLSKYVGTINFHNYTIQKTFKDPSARRHIKSFVVNPKPILIGEGSDEEKTEWLSLKVHGQSFMMHQIRKMVGMAALVVRCGSDLSTVDHSFTSARYSIPKVPGLGLMLERPVFDSYNNFTAGKNDREQLLFSKYDDGIEQFKRQEIYTKMFAEEEEKGEFSKFFNHIDNFRDSAFLWVTSKGLEAAQGAGRKDGYAEKGDKAED